MRDIWNPWHGCKKCSEGCQNCYMYYLDRVHGNFDSDKVIKTGNMNYPLSRNRSGKYIIGSGELLRVCMTSDFFIEDADEWREDAWDVIYQRPDVKFFLLTKRPQRVEKCLPRDWGDGWENVFFNVTCENQRRADERIPILHSLPFKHKGIMCAPLIGQVSIAKYLKEGQIEQVICGGENYDGARECRYEWVKLLHDECVEADVTFSFIETGNIFVKDGVVTRMRNKREQAKLAFNQGFAYKGKPVKFNLTDRLGLPIDESYYAPKFKRHCLTCGSRPICNGCEDCGRCKEDFVEPQEIESFDKLQKSK